MAEALERRGVAPERLRLDEASTDTLQNVVAAAAALRAHDLSRLVVCTDGYHLPRARMMLSLLGVASEPPPVEVTGTPGPELRRMRLRELAAYPYDALVVALRREALLREIDARSVRP